MQSSQAEVTRLMECVARSRVNFRRLNWNNAYFSNPEAFFSSVVSVSIITAYKSMNCIAWSFYPIFFLVIWSAGYAQNNHVRHFFPYDFTKNRAGHLLVAKILIVPHGLNNRDYVMCICSRNFKYFWGWDSLFYGRARGLLLLALAFSFLVFMLGCSFVCNFVGCVCGVFYFKFLFLMQWYTDSPAY